jgi:hypothetical protein
MEQIQQLQLMSEFTIPPDVLSKAEKSIFQVLDFIPSNQILTRSQQLAAAADSQPCGTGFFLQSARTAMSAKHNFMSECLLSFTQLCAVLSYLCSCRAKHQ